MTRRRSSHRLNFDLGDESQKVKITTSYIKSQIPMWIDVPKLQELREVWNEMNDGLSSDELPKLDFDRHIVNGKNWKRIHKEKCADGWIRMFELAPGDVFEGIFFMEVVTDGSDSMIKSVTIDNQ